MGRPKGSPNKRATDWTGRTFGEWTIVELLGRRPQYGKKAEEGLTIPQWLARCSCGNEKAVTATVIKGWAKKQEAIDRGQGSPLWRVHCNDNPIHLMPCQVGDRLGDLEVIGFPENKGEKLGWGKKERTYRDRWWIACLCHACGKYSKDEPYRLPMGHWNQRKERLANNPNTSCSCGCNRSVKHGMSRLQADGRSEEVEYTLWNAAKQRAKRQGIPFDLSPLDLKKLGIPEVCPVLGIPINQSPGDGTGERNDNSPSLDKFIPSLGYVKGNVHVISWRANRIKSDGSPEEWEKIAEWCQQEDVKRKMRGSDA